MDRMMIPKPSLTTPFNNCDTPKLAAVYVRFSTDKQDSADDQIRECKAWAEANGYDVPDELIFVGRALTGRSKKNPAFRALGEAAKTKKMQAAVFLSTSRLGRSLRKTLGMAEDIFKPNGVRGVFLNENIDMQDADKWQMLLSLHGLLDQIQATAGNTSIRASHKGQLKNREIFGKLPYGYSGKVIPGKVTKHGTPSHTIVIDEEQAEVVRRIFHWFVEDGMTVPALCRHLNEHIPAPPECPTRRWNYDVVRRILRNSRYIGQWSYGELENVWIKAEDRNIQVKRDEPLATESFEVLRIIDQRLWDRTQQKILNCPNRPISPRRRKGQSEAPLTPILGGLLFCGYHPHIRLTANGSHENLYCMVCQTTDKQLYSLLHRKEATAAVIRGIAHRLTANEPLVTSAASVCHTLLESKDTRLHTTRKQWRKQWQVA